MGWLAFLLSFLRIIIQLLTCSYTNYLPEIGVKVQILNMIEALGCFPERLVYIQYDEHIFIRCDSFPFCGLSFSSCASCGLPGNQNIPIW